MSVPEFFFGVWVPTFLRHFYDEVVGGGYEFDADALDECTRTINEKREDLLRLFTH